MTGLLITGAPGPRTPTPPEPDKSAGLLATVTALPGRLWRALRGHS